MAMKTKQSMKTVFRYAVPIVAFIAAVLFLTVGVVLEETRRYIAIGDQNYMTQSKVLSWEWRAVSEMMPWRAALILGGVDVGLHLRTIHVALNRASELKPKELEALIIEAITLSHTLPNDREASRLLNKVVVLLLTSSDIHPDLRRQVKDLLIEAIKRDPFNEEAKWNLELILSKPSAFLLDENDKDKDQKFRPGIPYPGGGY